MSTSDPRGGRLGRALRGRGDVALALGLFVLFGLVYGDYHVVGDGTDYFSFDRLLFGDSPTGAGYNFGVGLMNAPFYALGKLAQTLAGAHAQGHSLTAASITIASIVYVTLAGAAGAWLLGRLGFARHRGLAVGAAIFGTPVWYYGSFSPSYSHAPDAAVFSAIAVLAYLVWTGESTAPAIALGAALGLAVAVRPYNLAIAAVVVASLAVRRARAAAVAGIVGAVSFGLLCLIPLALGAGLTERADGSKVPSSDFLFAPLNPVRMLFSEHRGLLFWTPVACISVAGLAAASIAGRNAGYLRLLLLSFLGLLLAYATFARWDGGWSFSARYLASPVAVYVVGLGALFSTSVRPRRVAAVAGVVLLAAWSVFLGMSHAFGASISDGAFGVAERHAPADFVSHAWRYARVRHLL